MTGSAVSLCALTGVPALAAGQCYTFSGKAEAAQNYVVSIYVGATLVSQPVYSNDAWGGYFVTWETAYCNNAGVQNAQKIEPLSGSYLSGSDQFGAEPIGILVEALGGATTYPIAPTGVDWSSSHSITLYMSAASGNGQLLYFRVN
jgi:hypothetical protein